MLPLPKEFRVQIIFNNDLINELDAECPSTAQLEQYRLANDNNTIKIKASAFLEKRKPGRPPKAKPVELPPPSPIEEESEDEPIEDDLPEDPQEEDEFMDLENDFNMSISSNKKYTKRQMQSMGQLDGEPFIQLPQQKAHKQKKHHTLTEDDVQRRSMKELERKEKLQKQQEEQKQLTVHRILNEVGRKQRQRQVMEDKKAVETHKYRQLPADDIVIKYKSTTDGNYLQCPSYYTFEDIYQVDMYRKPPQVRPNCSAVGCYNISRYKMPQNQYACSVGCYKSLIIA